MPDPPAVPPRFSSVAELIAGASERTGLAEVPGRLRTVMVDTGLSSPAQLAGWRLGMAHVAPFVCSLPAGRQAELRQAAEAAVTGTGRLVVSMLVLVAR